MSAQSKAIYWIPLSGGEKCEEEVIVDAVRLLPPLAWEKEPNDKRAQASEWISSSQDGNERLSTRENEMRQRHKKKVTDRHGDRKK